MDLMCWRFFQSNVIHISIRTIALVSNSLHTSTYILLLLNLIPLSRAGGSSVHNLHLKLTKK